MSPSLRSIRHTRRKGGGAERNPAGNIFLMNQGQSFSLTFWYVWEYYDARLLQDDKQNFAQFSDYKSLYSMKNDKLIRYILVAVVFIAWIVMFPFFKEDFLEKFYYMPFLGVLGATVANTTPAAAGIIYFPILTRLHIAPLTAAQFNMMAQAYGMSLGTFRWFLLNRKLFLFNMLPICLISGLTGLSISIFFLPIDDPALLTLVFNCIAFGFTQIIFFSIIFKRKYPNSSIKLNFKSITLLMIFSFIGGMITGWIGFGIDTIFYFILTLIFRINPAIAIVTSISLMASMSLMGSIFYAMIGTMPLSLWHSAIPGITIGGLFVAAYVAVKIGPKNVLILFAGFLSIDFLTAVWTQQTIPMSQYLRMGIVYGLILYLLLVHVKIFKKGYKDLDNSEEEQGFISHNTHPIPKATLSSSESKSPEFRESSDLS